jgi:hypothetical protein
VRRAAWNEDGLPGLQLRFPHHPDPLGLRVGEVRSIEGVEVQGVREDVPARAEGHALRRSAARVEVTVEPTVHPLGGGGGPLAVIQQQAVGIPGLEDSSVLSAGVQVLVEVREAAVDVQAALRAGRLQEEARAVVIDAAREDCGDAVAPRQRVALVLFALLGEGPVEDAAPAVGRPRAHGGDDLSDRARAAVHAHHPGPRVDLARLVPLHRHLEP